MRVEQILSFISSWILRLGVIVFLLPLFYELWINPGSDDEIWFWVYRVFFAILYFVFSILILVLKRLRFYTFGFSLVLIASVYKLLILSYQQGLTMEHPVYILLIVVSFYFISKSERVTRRKRSF
ncbi:MAG: hypothetical protein K8R41_03800 [Bacteroidales bacterium]|nr:hypothetical protein [Bacteroidales bacterium]